MNYELAKKLKDEGFPMRDGGGDTSREQFRGNDGEVYHIPFLHELIEACRLEMDRISSTKRGLALYSHPSREIYEASTYITTLDAGGKESLPRSISVKGLSLDETVALLYLAINKK